MSLDPFACRRSIGSIFMKTTTQTVFKLATMLILFCCMVSSSAAEFKLKVSENKIPDQVATSIASTLEGKTYEIMKGDDLIYRFWFRKEIPLSSKPDTPEDALAAFIQPELIGIVEVPEESRDYRDDELFKNIFTIRYGIRPDDGNHLGTSDYRHFAVLIPAKMDKELDGIDGYKSLVKKSSSDTISDHPVILSLRPVDGESGKLPSLTEPARHHHALRVELLGKVKESEMTASVKFDLVFDGYAEF